MSASKETLTITDNRTGKQYEVPIQDGTIRAMDLRQIKSGDDDFGLMTYDPAFMNTASCKSTITYIDGDRGELEYRGYPIDQLAEKSTYLEVAYLLLHGELPTAEEMKQWTWDITHHTFINENIRKVLDGFHYNAHPMGMFEAMVAALSTFYPESKNIRDEACRRKQIHRLIAKVPTIAAFAYRHRVGLPISYPDNDLTYEGNFLNMMFKTTELKYQPNPVLEKALSILFILHGANEAVLRMLNEIGSVEHVPEYVKRVKAGEFRLMGFGHRVYKNYDPRARIIKQVADEVFEVTGKDPLLNLALELERIALEDEYFVKRRLYPNVDFYSGIIYRAMKFPVDMFPVLFAIPRTSGWLAQWVEMLDDPEQKIARPRQIYLGARTRDYVPMSQRDGAAAGQAAGGA